MMSSWVLYDVAIFIISIVGLTSGMLVFLPLTSQPGLLSFSVKISNLELVPFFMVLMISFLVFHWARYYMNKASSLTLFLLVLFLFVMSMFMLIISSSFMTIFLGWEGLGITSFLLIIYYQNWSSFQGGLLTLLTNRIGDGILMLSFCYWILQFGSNSLNSEMSIYVSGLLFFLALTKSAQVPFTSWLPAAMAAPTPVSALVHSSTLVTAGIWLMIKYGNKMLLFSIMWLFIGMVTLTLASTAAIVESDGKKIVALSTLSQLGLMFISLKMGGSYICLFHLLMHAFAKANLFLVVGNLIHSRFSLQDIRFMSVGSQSNTMVIMFLVSVLSLSGVLFFSGFYSKDFILISEYSFLNSVISFILLIIIISMTLVYCFKFLFMLNLNKFKLESFVLSVASVIPSSVLSVMSMILGYFFSKNLMMVAPSKFSGFYWGFLLIMGLFMGILFYKQWSLLFLSQLLLISKFNEFFFKMSKVISFSVAKGFLESSYLVSFLFYFKILLMKRLLMLLSLTVLFILMVF